MNLRFVVISRFQQQDLLIPNVLQFETPTMNTPSPGSVIDTASKDILEPANTIIATEIIEANNEKSATPKKVS